MGFIKNLISSAQSYMDNPETEENATNPRFADFKNLSKEEDIAQQKSVIEKFMQGENTGSFQTLGYDYSRSYSEFVYGAVSSNKVQRLNSYRRMASFPEISNAIDEICDAMLNYDENGDIVSLDVNTSNNLSVLQITTLNDEFKNYISLFDLEYNYFDYARTLITDGELAFENIIDEERKSEGIIGVNILPNESFEFLVDQSSKKQGIMVYVDDPYKENGDKNNNTAGSTQGGVKTQEINAAYKEMTSPNAGTSDEVNIHLSNKTGIPLPWDQITYIDSGSYNYNKIIVYPVLEKARKAYRQLALIEDAILIYRLVRAPERLVFNVATGKLARSKAEQEVYKMMKRYQTKKFYNPLTGSVSNDYDPHQLLECLALDTKIPLLDGRTLELKEIINEFQNGKQLWAYSCDPKTGKFAPGKIDYAAVTRKNAEVMKITFDNGKSITCTPDHKFPVWEKGKTEAKDLQINDSIISFQTKKEKLKNSEKLDYLQVFDHEDNEWKYVHQVVADTFKNTLCKPFIYDKNNISLENAYEVRHHLDYNRYNNNPENLAWMNFNDHWNYHSNIGYTHKYDPKFKQKLYEKVSNTLKETYKRNPSLQENQSKYMLQRHTDVNFTKKINEKNKEWWNKNKHLFAGKYTIKINDEIVNALINIINSKKIYLKKDIITYCNNNDNMLTKIYFNLNKNNNRISGNINDKVLTQIAKYCNFNTYHDFIINVYPSYLSNHYKNNRKINSKECPIIYSHDMIKSLIDIMKTYNFKNQDELIFWLNSNKNNNFYIDFYNLNINTPQYDGIIRKQHILNLVRQNGYANFRNFKKQHMYHNHRVVKIEYLQERIDTGTLTIDQNEECHNYHLFATDSGVYTSNSYWFPKGDDSEGTTVSTLQTSASWTELPDLEYFQKKLWLALKVPMSRFLNPTVNIEKNNTITYEEYRFAKFVMRIQSRFSAGISKGFITHLKLRGMWEQYKLTERDIKVSFTPPASYDLYEQQKLLQIKFENYSTVVGDHEEMSKELAMVKYLGWSEDDLKKNREYKEKEMLWMASLKHKADKIEKTGNPYE